MIFQIMNMRLHFFWAGFNCEAAVFIIRCHCLNMLFF